MKTQHLIGRISDEGLRVMVQIDLSGTTLTIQGGAWLPGEGDFDWGGQVYEALTRVDELEPGWTQEDQISLMAIWQQWSQAEEPIPPTVLREIERLQTLPKGDLPPWA